MVTVAQIRAEASQQLLHSESAHLDADVLLMQVLDCDRARLFAWPEQMLSLEQQAHFAVLLARRIEGEPVAHLVGEKEFWSLPLRVDYSTLIPRPETELLVELALQKLPAATCSATRSVARSVLDLGTGTGAIALALAKERPLWQVLACDKNPEAVALAQHNAAQLQLDNVRVLESDWFAAITNKTFDLIVSNPPYIAINDPHLELGDVRFEPRSALVSGKQGLADLETISQQAHAFLKADAWLMLEHGFEQGAAVRALLRDAGYVSIETFRDLQGHERATIAQKGKVNDREISVNE